MFGRQSCVSLSIDGNEICIDTEKSDYEGRVYFGYMTCVMLDYMEMTKNKGLKI